MCIEKNHCRVLANNIFSEPFNISTGLKQGDAIKPILFNIALEKVIRETTAKDAHCSALFLGYADDIINHEYHRRK